MGKSDEKSNEKDSLIEFLKASDLEDSDMYKAVYVIASRSMLLALQSVAIDSKEMVQRLESFKEIVLKTEKQHYSPQVLKAANEFLKKFNLEGICNVPRHKFHMNDSPNDNMNAAFFCGKQQFFTKFKSEMPVLLDTIITEVCADIKIDSPKAFLGLYKNQIIRDVENEIQAIGTDDVQTLSTDIIKMSLSLDFETVKQSAFLAVPYLVGVYAAQMTLLDHIKASIPHYKNGDIVILNDSGSVSKETLSAVATSFCYAFYQYVAKLFVTESHEVFQHFTLKDRENAKAIFKNGASKVNVATISASSNPSSTLN